MIRARDVILKALALLALCCIVCPLVILPGFADIQIHYLDVGQGDAAVIQCDGEVMMIDGGEPQYSQFIYSFLRNTLGIEYIDVMVATHPHSDHVGGLAAALNACEVGVLYTSQIEYDSSAWQAVLKYADAQGTPVIIPMPDDEFTLGGANVDIIGPRYFSNETNNLSLIMRITYGDNTFLFTGDAEIAEEGDLLDAGVDLNADVLKVCHHGSDTSSSSAFLQKVNPRFAIISVGKDNIYGHPTEEVLSRLEDAGAVVIRTDVHGTIECISDGASIVFNLER